MCPHAPGAPGQCPFIKMALLKGVLPYHCTLGSCPPLVLAITIMKAYNCKKHITVTDNREGLQVHNVCALIFPTIIPLSEDFRQVLRIVKINIQLVWKSHSMRKAERGKNLYLCFHSVLHPQQRFSALMQVLEQGLYISTCWIREWRLHLSYLASVNMQRSALCR